MRAEEGSRQMQTIRRHLKAAQKQRSKHCSKIGVRAIDTKPKGRAPRVGGDLDRYSAAFLCIRCGRNYLEAVKGRNGG